ncbi:MAG TPA: DUF4149 domain-containing protein [Candidatus Dormibacteraeota bacterium]|nr:DUF4149 domain-containing protein [Candidatus Dormibacteraeota bacterium]
MPTFLRTLEFLSLSVWLGSIVFLSFIVAPAAFSAASRDQAGAMVGLVLARMHWMGIAAGFLFLGARIIRFKSLGALATPVALTVIVMILLTLASQLGVSSKMAMLRNTMGSIDATPLESPLRTEFQSLHRRSVIIEISVLAAGIATLVWLVRENTL